MAELSLAQIRGATRDPAVAMIADTLLVNDQFLGNLPMIDAGESGLYSYTRKIADPAVAFVAADGAMSSDASYIEVNIVGQCRRLYTQQGVDRQNAGQAGGLAMAKAKRAASSIGAFGRSIGQKLLTGGQALSGTIVSSGMTVANGFSITAVGPNVITSRGSWEIKYVHTGTFVSVRAPGDLDFGPAVAIGTNTTANVFSYDRDRYVTVAHGSQALSANDAGIITFSGGTNEFDGFFTLIAGQTSRVIYAGSAATNGANLALTDLDTLIESVKGAARPDKRLVMGTRTWVSFQALARTAAAGNQFAQIAGQQLPSYNGVPILVTDYMPITQTRGSASTCSSVICATFGEDEGLVGYFGKEPTGAEPNAAVYTEGPMGLTVWDLGMGATAHNSTLRTVGHVSLGLVNTVKVGVLQGVLN